jgi:hypothetical protein
MHDIVVCHGVQQKNVRQSSTHHYKGLVMYNKKHEFIAMSRHIFWKHYIVLNLYKAQRLVTTNVSLKAQ